jgi:hypothetical protein
LLSLIGALFIVYGSWEGSSHPSNIDLFDRMYIGGAFISSSFVGIAVALKPNILKGRPSHRNAAHGTSINPKIKRKTLGHHPDCSKFPGHTFKTSSSTLCGGCTGLAVGAALTAAFMTAFIFVPIEFSQQELWIIIIIGFLLVTAVNLEIITYHKSTAVHVSINALMAPGFFLIVIGSFSLTGNKTLGIMALIISFLWLDTRIQFSKWRHNSICKNCNEQCKFF